VVDDRRVLEGVEKLVVDGTNVLHMLLRSATPVPAAALIGRLRAIVPAGVEVVVVLDGSPEHGLVSRKVASGVEVRYAGRWTADDVITGLAERDSAAGRAGMLVVTDDIALGAAVRRAGGRTVRTAWLIDRLGRQRLSAPSAGGATTPAGSIGDSGAGGARPNPEAEAAETPRWTPGRGATRKIGNGRRRPGTGR
jgi:hypothetical protein